MRLVGLYISPFVRRVAIALNYYGFNFDRVEASVVDGRDEIGKYNGLVRVPALELEDGLVLIDSHQILAELDRRVGQERALLPQQPENLQSFGQMLAYLTGSLEKTVAYFYETKRRPQEKVWQDWAIRCLDQSVGGLLSAEDLAKCSGVSSDFLFEDRITHADIAAVLAYEALASAAPNRINVETCPRISSLFGRLARADEFLSTVP
jgi:glutathione S-transferase